MPAYYIREARVNLGMGIHDGFETILSNALATSKAVFGETSASYPNTLLDTGELCTEYGNYRIRSTWNQFSLPMDVM